MTDSAQNQSATTNILTVPVLPVSGRVILPGTMEILLLEPALADEVVFSCPMKIAVPPGKPWALSSTKPTQTPPHLLCVVDVEHIEKRRDDEVMIVVQGLFRAQVLEWIATSRNIHHARVKPMPDRMPSSPDIDRTIRERELLEGACELLHNAVEKHLLRMVFARCGTFGELSDVLAQALPLHHEEQLALLSEPQVDFRSDLLLDAIRRAKREQRQASHSWPPDFGRN